MSSHVRPRAGLSLRLTFVSVTVVSAAATLAVATLPGLHFAYRRPPVHIALETAAALIALLAAFLVFGRVQRGARLDELVLACALGVLALSNLLFAAVPALIEDFPNDRSVWAAITGRTLGAMLLACSPFLPSRGLGDARRATRVAVAVTLGALVATAVANGDFSQKITVEAKGEILELKNTLNAMVDQLRTFVREVTRVAREVGTEGRLGGQAQVPGVGGTWQELTESVNVMASNLTSQVRGIAKVVTAVANGDLGQKLVLEARGEIASLADTINDMTQTLRTFADQVTTVAREVGAEGRLGGQARGAGHAGLSADDEHRAGRERRRVRQQVRRGARDLGRRALLAHARAAGGGRGEVVHSPRVQAAPTLPRTNTP